MIDKKTREKIEKIITETDKLKNDLRTVEINCNRVLNHGNDDGYLLCVYLRREKDTANNRLALQILLDLPTKPSPRKAHITEPINLFSEEDSVNWKDVTEEMKSGWVKDKVVERIVFSVLTKNLDAIPDGELINIANYFELPYYTSDDDNNGEDDSSPFKSSNSF